MTSFYPRGQAVSGYSFGLISKNTGDPITSGTVTVYVTKDSGAQAAATNAPVHNGNGEWLLDLTASERDAKTTSLTILHADAVPLHFNIVSDDQQGPGALACLIQLGALGALADVWITTVVDDDNVIASGQADTSGNITFYLDAGSYYVFRQKPLVDFDPNPATISVAVAATFDISVFTATAESTLELQSLTTLADAEDYFSSRLNTDAWDDASDLNKQKALSQATRAINRLAYQGDVTDAALAAGNQFPRGLDTEVPYEIKWAVAEEALSLLNGNDPESMVSNVVSEKFSGASVTYNIDAIPDYVHSGITSGEAWRFLKPYLRDRRSMRFVRT